MMGHPFLGSTLLKLINTKQKNKINNSFSYASCMQQKWIAKNATFHRLHFMIYRFSIQPYSRDSMMQDGSQIRVRVLKFGGL